MKRPRSKIPNLHARLVGPPDCKVTLWRWAPGPSMRARGFRAIDLWADGPAYTKGDCESVGFSEALPLRHRLKGSKNPKPMSFNEAKTLARRMNALAHDSAAPAAPTPRRIVCAAAPLRALFTDFMASDDWNALRPKTRKSYQSHIGILNAIHGDNTPLSLTAQLIKDHYTERARASGPSAANMDLVVLRRCLNWAQKRDRWRGLLPGREDYSNLRTPTPKGRLRVALPNELNLIQRAFDDPGALYDELGTQAGERILTPRPSAWDGAMLMLWTAARVNDALGFSCRASDGTTLVYVPSKSVRADTPQGKTLTIPIQPPLAARLGDAQRRRRAMLGANADTGHIVINEDDRRPYVRVTAGGISGHKPYTDIWKPYMALAGQFEPSIIGKAKDRLDRQILPLNAQDFRDTAVTRLMMAKCTIFQIAAWHGSEPKVILDLVKHYIEIGPEQAEEAGEKLMTMMSEQGWAV